MGVALLPLICGIAISVSGLMASAEESPPSLTPVVGEAVADPGFAPMLADLQRRFPGYASQQVIVIDTTAQELLLLEQGRVTGSWVISSAEAGVGSHKGSNQTPLGVHRIAKKFGENAPLGTVFRARQNTGRVARILTEPGARSGEDNVTTRIMWLDGLEPGINKGGDVDSYQRYIYIHGTDEEGRLGSPASHGCIRMKNQDVVDLFARVGVDTLVVIARRKE